VTPGLPFGPHPCNPFALVVSPKLGLRQGGSLVPCLTINQSNHNPQAHYDNNGMPMKAHNLSPEVSHKTINIDYQEVNLKACVHPAQNLHVKNVPHRELTTKSF
jgi:hypothetical protein